MLNPRFNCRKRYPSRHGDSHRSRASGRGAVADLALSVRAPTIGCTRTGYRTGVVTTYRKRRNG